MTTKEQVLNTLQKVMDPELHRNIVELNMVRDLVIDDNDKVSFTLALTTLACPLKEKIASDARDALKTFEGIDQVEIKFSEMSRKEAEALFKETKPSFPDLTKLNKIDQVIAVMSGKGGVGKSSVTAMLAVHLVNRGMSIGILDADVTGPSIPRLFGLGSGGLRGSEQGILPACSSKGVKIVSTNLLLQEEDMPTIWRGPLISGTINQFWTNSIWGKLDVLLVDLPPGTSDAALTVMQSLPVSSVVLVTTPQELASMVVRKAVHMVQMLKVPIIGLVENMSSFRCPDCGNVHYLFGKSHLDEMAKEVENATTIQLPIDSNLTALCDTGKIEAFNNEEISPLVDRIISNRTFK